MIETKKETILLNRRPVESSITSVSGGKFRYGTIEVPVGAPGATCMAGRSGRLTQTQRMFVSWQSGLGKYEVQIKQLNRSRYVSIADMYPDDAEMLALMILEAVKKARDDGK